MLSVYGDQIKEGHNESCRMLRAGLAYGADTGLPLVVGLMERLNPMDEGHDIFIDVLAVHKQ